MFTDNADTAVEARKASSDLDPTAGADPEAPAAGEQLEQLGADQLAAPAAQRAHVRLVAPRRADTTIGARSARAAISS